MHIVEQFYTAFTAKDTDKMIACYHDEVVFEDPAFGRLEGDAAKQMWRMLCASQKGKQFDVTFKALELTDTSANVKWEAKYNFSQTGRPVHNKITANIKLKDGLIIEHIDRFSLHRWGWQAFGSKGFFLGWTGAFRRKLQAQTNKLLLMYSKRNPLK